jgi:hypothetical protein
MDAIAIHEDERSHLGVPTTGLVAKMNTSFKKLLHRDNVCQKQDPPFLFLRSFLIDAKVSFYKVIGENYASHNPYLPLYLQLANRGTPGLLSIKERAYFMHDYLSARLVSR